MATPALVTRVQTGNALREVRGTYQRGFCPNGCGTQMLVDKNKPDLPCLACCMKQQK